ncbi:hypothetical protein [Marmoricola sp. Leaf446]|uniref:hypothetical protein n=1 Tax=Marmoricola sp. Leaf446 TaxID=1736379 RepID=UPI0012E35BC7|nr:hypothetical protein [Marmoricola sp. Leaf446]
MTSPATLDFSRAMELLEEARSICNRLHGQGTNVESNDRSKAANRAEVSRLILFAGHLGDCARLEIQSQFHLFKGQENVPRVTPT